MGFFNRILFYYYEIVKYFKRNRVIFDTDYLYPSDKCGLIINGKSGIFWSNQCGGYTCDHPIIEGSFICVDIPSKEFDFIYEKYNGWCCEGITKEDADQIDIRLRDYRIKYNRGNIFNMRDFSICVDRKKIKQSKEAWIYIVTSTGKRGVLVYENSD
jgi:hypothetical protein